MEDKHNLLGVLRTLFKRIKIIIYITGIAAIGSVILSLMQDNYYEAATLFYAANHDLAKPDPVGSAQSSRNYYGTGEDMDRIMTIAQSNDIATYLIDHFQLYKHYDIDTTKRRAAYTVRFKLGNLYNVTKTKYDAIEIAIEDKDPKMAADMANEAREKLNQLAQMMVKGSQAREIASIENNILSKGKDIKLLSDSLKTLRVRYKIIDPWSQGQGLPDIVTFAETELASKQASLETLEEYPSVDPDTIILIKAAVSGLQKKYDMVSEQLILFRDGVSEVESIIVVLQELREQLALDVQRLQQLRSAYNAEFTAIHLIEAASPPIIKSRPKRSIIVLSAVFIAFFFAVIGVLLFENYKSVNWREIIHGQ